MVLMVDWDFFFVGDVFFKDRTLGFITIKPPPLSDMFDLLPSAEQANLSTPPKFNMEAKNQTLEKEIPFGNHHFQVPCLSLGVVFQTIHAAKKDDQ